MFEPTSRQAQSTFLPVTGHPSPVTRPSSRDLRAIIPRCCMQEALKGHRMRRSDKVLITVGVVLTVLIIARAALPIWTERFINRQLAAIEGYDGRVEDVDFALWRGGFGIDDIRIVRTTADRQTPFFDCERIDVTLEWKSLINGTLAAEGKAVRPVLNLVQARTKEESQMGTETKWPTGLADYYPFEINTFRVLDATITFRAPGIQSEDALTANHVNAVVSNLRNVADSGKEAFARFETRGEVLGKAPMAISGSLDPLAKSPTFDVNMALEQVQLTDINPWLRQFLKADAQSGTFQLYLELAAADGAFKGYAKPLMQNVDMYGSQENNDTLLRKVWEGLVEFAANIVENEEEEQVGARIPFSGTIDDPQTSIWQTIASVLRNAFVSAFARSLEGSISIRNVRENLSEVSDASGIETAADKKEEQEKAQDEKKQEKRERGRGPRASG